MPLAVAILRESLRAARASERSGSRVLSEMIAQVAAFFKQLVAFVHPTLEEQKMSFLDFVSESDGLVPIFWDAVKRLRCELGFVSYVCTFV